jgi:hypothetical protein
MECNCIINTRIGVMLVPRMLRELTEGSISDNIIDVVDLRIGTVLHQLKTKLKEIENGWEDRYFVSWSRRDNNNSNKTIFTSIMLITKQAMYIKMIQCLKVEQKYGRDICEKVLALLEGEEEEIAL